MAYMLLSMSNFSDKSAEQWSHLSMSCCLIVAGSVPEKGVATSQNSSEFDDWSGVRDRISTTRLKSRHLPQAITEDMALQVLEGIFRQETVPLALD